MPPIEVVVECNPACEPNVAQPLPENNPPVLTPPIDPTPVTPSAVTATGVDCAGAPVVVNAVGVVQTVPDPNAVQKVKICDNNEYDHTILCDDLGNKVLVTVTYNNVGIPTVAAYNFPALTPYLGVIADLISCAGSPLESDAVLGCADGDAYVQWIVKSAGVPTGDVYYTDGSGAVVPEPVDFQLGACQLQPEIITGEIIRYEAVVAGSTLVNRWSVDFLNVGTDPATVMSAPLLPGERINFTGYYDRSLNRFVRVPNIDYIASATAILHITEQE